MARAQEATEPQGMKIAQLCRESGFTRATVHHYVNIGLLHRPRQVGLNLHLFDETHLNRLKQIRRLREKEGLPLADIRELLDRIEPREAVVSIPEGVADPSAQVRSKGEKLQGSATRQERKNREMILDTAIKLFSERGYENTKISDITDALHMGKGTFYVYFKNKKELFMECIDRLTVTIVPREAWAEIRREKDFNRKTWKRAAAFLDAFPGFRGILSMLRIALGGRDRALAEKAREAFKILSAPMVKDLRRAISRGLVRPDVDVDLFAFLQLCLAEGLGYWMMMEPQYSADQGMDTLIGILGNGLRQKGDAKPKEAVRGTGPAELKDSRGMITQLNDIRVNGKPFLPGRIGDGEMELDLTRTSRMDIVREGAGCLARTTLRDGNEVLLEVDGEMTVAAEAPFGAFRIPLGRVASIFFGRK